MALLYLSTQTPLGISTHVTTIIILMHKNLNMLLIKQSSRFSLKVFLKSRKTSTKLHGVNMRMWLSSISFIFTLVFLAEYWCESCVLLPWNDSGIREVHLEREKATDGQSGG
jgi:hypothetical protein